MNRRTSQPRPAVARFPENPKLDAAMKEIFDRLPANLLPETRIREIIREVVLEMKAEGVI